MKKTIIIAAVLAVGLLGLFAYITFYNSSLISPLSKQAKKIVEKPLEKYTFERLRQTAFEPSPITLGGIVNETPTSQARVFYFTVNNKKVSGLLNTPVKAGNYPIIVQFRGFVPLEIYTVGEGTKRSGEVMAQNGFVTVAPDFLGYGESDKPSDLGLEERFQTYTTALTLLASLDNLNASLSATSSGALSVDTKKVGIWGHSNGGHIALSVLAITGKDYPAVLWNPVTKPFPYSILYFTDEYVDNGKALRKLVADFEEDYNIELYSTANFYPWIQAPIQLHQAVDDEAVPIRWSNQFVEKMEELEKDIDYFMYPGDDHNFAKGSWNTVVLRGIQFFNSHFQEE